MIFFPMLKYKLSLDSVDPRFPSAPWTQPPPAPSREERDRQDRTFFESEEFKAQAEAEEADDFLFDEIFPREPEPE